MHRRFVASLFGIAVALTASSAHAQRHRDTSPDRVRHLQLDVEVPMRFGPGGPLMGIAGYVGYADGAMNELGRGMFLGAGAALAWEPILDDDRCQLDGADRCRLSERTSFGPQLRLGWAWGQSGGDEGPDAYAYVLGGGFVSGTTDRSVGFGTRLGFALTWVSAFETMVEEDGSGSHDGGAQAFTFLLALMTAAVAGHVEVGWEMEVIDGVPENRGYFAFGFGY